MFYWKVDCGIRRVHFVSKKFLYVVHALYRRPRRCWWRWASWRCDHVNKRRKHRNSEKNCSWKSLIFLKCFRHETCGVKQCLISIPQQLLNDVNNDPGLLKRLNLASCVWPHLIEIKSESKKKMMAIPKSAFQKWFEDWKKCWLKCNIPEGDYFEGDNQNSPFLLNTARTHKRTYIYINTFR